jgi:hypothetical protein
MVIRNDFRLSAYCYCWYNNGTKVTKWELISKWDKILFITKVFVYLCARLKQLYTGEEL